MEILDENREEEEVHNNQGGRDTREESIHLQGVSVGNLQGLSIDGGEPRGKGEELGEVGPKEGDGKGGNKSVVLHNGNEGENKGEKDKGKEVAGREEKDKEKAIEGGRNEIKKWKRRARLGPAVEDEGGEKGRKRKHSEGVEDDLEFSEVEDGGNKRKKHVDVDMIDAAGVGGSPSRRAL